MQFRDSKQGYPIYVFDRKALEIKVGKITNTPMPHFDSMAGGKMVVDINIEIDGISTQYVMEEMAEVGYAGEKVVSVSKDAILREVERVKNQSEDALKMNDYHKEAVTKCNQLMKEYSPEYKERTETSERMSALEDKVGKLTDALSELLNKMERNER